MSTKENSRILVIDDNEAIHEDFRKILNQEPENLLMVEIHNALFAENTKKNIFPTFEIDSAYQGHEGIELVRNAVKEGRPYAMAFVDVLMPPGIDGIETIKLIWKEDADIQIAICTAYPNYSWKDIVTELGISDQLLILKKPFESIEIRQMASCLVKKWNLSQKVGHQYDKLRDLLLTQTAETQKFIQENKKN